MSIAVLASMLFILAGPPSHAEQDSGFGLRLDLGSLDGTMDDSVHADTRWQQGALVDVREYWDVDVEAREGGSFGAALFYKFNPRVTLELEGRGVSTRLHVRSRYYANWQWEDGSSYWSEYHGREYDEARMNTAVGSLNLLVYLTDPRRCPVRPFVTVGLSAYDTDLEGEFDTAWAYTYTDAVGQHLRWDYPIIDLDADATTYGVNLGAGGDWYFNHDMALTFALKYYYSDSEQVTFGSRSSYPELADLTLEVDPSFLMATGGIKFVF